MGRGIGAQVLAEHADRVTGALLQVLCEGVVVDESLIDVHAARAVRRLDVVEVTAGDELGPGPARGRPVT